MTPVDQCVPDLPAHCFDMGERRRDPTIGGKMFFPEARRGAHRWNSCWKHQELWMLVGLLSRPSGTLKFTPGALPRFSLFPIQHVCFIPLLFQPSSSLNNYPSSSSFNSFSSFPVSVPLSENFALHLHSLYLHPHPSTSLVSFYSCLRPPPHVLLLPLQKGEEGEEAARDA